VLPSTASPLICHQSEPGTAAHLLSVQRPCHHHQPAPHAEPPENSYFLIFLSNASACPCRRAGTTPGPASSGQLQAACNHPLHSILIHIAPENDRLSILLLARCCPQSPPHPRRLGPMQRALSISQRRRSETLYHTDCLQYFHIRPRSNGLFCDIWMSHSHRIVDEGNHTGRR